MSPSSPHSSPFYYTHPDKVSLDIVVTDPIIQLVWLAHHYNKIQNSTAIPLQMAHESFLDLVSGRHFCPPNPNVTLSPLPTGSPKVLSFLASPETLLSPE